MGARVAKGTATLGRKKSTKNTIKNSTYEQILERSRILFNRFGAESVSISHIAESMAISAGNLTYHFKRKRDIVVALLENLNQGFSDVVDNFPLTAKVDEYVASYASLFSLIWRYRFLFNTTSYLLNQELLTGDEYKKLIDDIKAIFLRQTITLVDQGHMSPVSAPYTLETLIDCMWWLWVGWLQQANVLALANQRQVDKPVIVGTRHFLFLIQPYINKRYFARMLHAVETLELSADERKQVS